MRIVVVGLIVFMLACLASAENESLEDLFASGDATIIPPTIEGEVEFQEVEKSMARDAEPTDDMYIALTGATAEAPTMEAAADGNGLHNLLINVIDARTGASIKDAHIRLYLSDGQQQVGTLRFVGDDGQMLIQLPTGTWRVTLKLDMTETPGKDYYSQFETLLSADREVTAFMQPVGSITGEVIDAEDNLIPGALIKFECSGDYGEVQSLSTDSFGAFSAEWLPVGTCRISALSGKVGSAQSEITHGQVSTVTVTLEKGLSNGESDITWIVILVLVILIAILSFLFIRKKGSAVVKQEPKEIKPDNRMADILSALDENERKIVELLMSKGGEHLQNKIARELNFPKSSLSRAIGGLEARNIITTEKLGRIKRVELSQWFLNGKKPE